MMLVQVPGIHCYNYCFVVSNEKELQDDRHPMLATIDNRKTNAIIAPQLVARAV